MFFLEEFNKYFKNETKKKGEHSVKMILRNQPAGKGNSTITAKFDSYKLNFELEDKAKNLYVFKEYEGYTDRAGVVASDYVKSFSEYLSLMKRKEEVIFIGGQYAAQDFICLANEEESWDLLKVDASNKLAADLITSSTYVYRDIEIEKSSDYGNYKFKTNESKTYAFPKGSMMHKVYLEINTLLDLFFKSEELYGFKNQKLTFKNNSIFFEFLLKNIFIKGDITIEQGSYKIIFNNYQNPELIEKTLKIPFEEVDAGSGELMNTFVEESVLFAEEKNLEFLLNPNLTPIIEKIEEILRPSKKDGYGYGGDNERFKKRLDNTSFEKVLNEHFNVVDLLERIDNLQFKYSYFTGIDSILIEFEDIYILADSLIEFKEYQIIKYKTDVVKAVEARKEVMYNDFMRKLTNSVSKATTDIEAKF